MNSKTRLMTTLEAMWDANDGRKFELSYLRELVETAIGEARDTALKDALAEAKRLPDCLQYAGYVTKGYKP